MTKENKWFAAAALFFVIGIVIGGVYCAVSSGQSDMYEYLTVFEETVKNGADKQMIFKNSLISDLRFVFIIGICGFFRFGFAAVFGAAAIRGFSTGFTFAALVKYLGRKGILIMVSLVVPELLMLLVTVVFGGMCAYMSCVKKDRYIISSFLLILILGTAAAVMSAGFEGYASTEIVRIISEKIT